MNESVNVAWLRKAAEQGQAQAQFDFALKCAKGQGIPKDTIKAYFWLLLARMQLPELASSVCEEIQSGLSPTQRDMARNAVQRWRPS
jgi:hypothetical protein